MVGIAGLWVYFAFRADRSLRKNVINLIAGSAFALAYGYGTAVVANGMLDHTRPTVISSRITDKRTSTGKVTQYKLSIEPWRTGQSEDTVSVARSTYESLNVGDTACVYVNDGALGIAWYTVDRCQLPR